MGGKILAARHELVRVQLIQLGLRLGQRVALDFSPMPTPVRIGTMTGIVPSGQGHLLTARGNVLAFKAVAAQTGGDFSLMERTVPPGARTLRRTGT